MENKKIENLKIPLKAVFNSERIDWHPEKPTILDSYTMEIEMDCGCGQLIKGFLEGDNIKVTELEMHGEGSGSCKYYILDEALKESGGELEAVLVWEGDYNITKLKLKDGELCEIDVEW